MRFNMRSIFLLSLFYFCISCLKTEPYPKEKIKNHDANNHRQKTIDEKIDKIKVCYWDIHVIIINTENNSDYRNDIEI